MIVLSEDHLKYADITNSTQIVTYSGHPITNIQDSRLSRNAWIIPEALRGQLYGIKMYGVNPYYDQYALEDVNIDFDMKAVKDFDTFALAGNNFSIITLALSWAMTDINVPDGTVSYNYSSPLQAVVIPTGAQSARYFRLTIGNVLPTGNYEVIGRVALGNKVSFPAIRTVYDVDLISTANRTLSDSQQLYGGPKVIYKRVSVSFPYIQDPAELMQIFRDVDLYNPFFLSFDEECITGPENLYCTLSEDSLPLNHNDAKFFTSRLSFTEVF